MADFTNTSISSSYQRVLQVDGGQIQDGLGLPVSATIESLTATSGLTGSLLGTSLYALTASYVESASFASTASYALNVEPQDTGSLLTTGSVSLNTLTFTKGDGSTFDLTVDTGSAETTNTGSLLTTASINDANITFTKGDGSTFNIEVNNISSSISASYATTASYLDGNIDISSDATNVNQYLTFVSNTGSQQMKLDAGITYNPSSNTLQTTTINAGTVTATNINGNIGVAADSTNATRYVTFADGTSGNSQMRVDTSMTYNPSINRLTVTNINADTIALSSTNYTTVLLRYYLTAPQSIPTNTFPILTGWTSDVVLGSGMNTTTGVFTAPYTGYYKVNVAATYSTAAGAIGNEYNVAIFKNSSRIAQTSYRKATTTSMPIGTLTIPDTLVELTAGDTIDFRVFQNSGASVVVSNGFTQTVFNIERIITLT